jgi:hypothetical protein
MSAGKIASERFARFDSLAGGKRLRKQEKHAAVFPPLVTAANEPVPIVLEVKQTLRRKELENVVKIRFDCFGVVHDLILFKMETIGVLAGRVYVA